MRQPAASKRWNRLREWAPFAAAAGLLSLLGALSSAPPFAALGLWMFFVAVWTRPRGHRATAWVVASAPVGLALLCLSESPFALYAESALIFLGWLMATAPQSRARTPSANGPHHAVFWATLVAIVLAWLPFWLGYYPGLMSPDSLSAWSQALSFRLSDLSPAAYTLLIWLAGTPLRSPAFVSLLQLLLSALLIASLFAYLSSRRTPRGLLATGLAIYLALPIFGTYTVTLWHDVIYSLLVLWVTHAMYAMYTTRGAWLAVRSRRWALGAALVLLPLFAHNGFSVVFGVLAGAWLLLRPQRRTLCRLALGVFGGLLACQFIIYPALGVEPLSKAFASEAMLHQIGAAIAQHGTSQLTAPERRYLRRIMPLRDWAKDYNAYTPESLVAPRNPAYNEEPIDRDYGTFIRVWAAIGRKYPSSYLDERIAENALVLRPTGDTEMLISMSNIAANGLGLKTESVAPPLLRNLRQITSFTTRHLLWAWCPFWAMWLLCALTLVGALRRGTEVLFAALPWFFQVLGLAVSIQGQSVRYYYSLFLVLPYVLAIALRPSADRRPRAIARTAGPERVAAAG